MDHCHLPRPEIPPGTLGVIYLYSPYDSVHSVCPSLFRLIDPSHISSLLYNSSLLKCNCLNSFLNASKIVSSVAILTPCPLSHVQRYRRVYPLYLRHDSRYGFLLRVLLDRSNYPSVSVMFACFLLFDIFQSPSSFCKPFYKFISTAPHNCAHVLFV